MYDNSSTLKYQITLVYQNIKFEYTNLQSCMKYNNAKCRITQMYNVLTYM